MSCKTLAQDITSATNTATTSGSDLFVFSRNSQAYSIAFSSLTTQLGATGCIKSQGSSASVSILNQPAQGYNYIRGLEPSQGITAAVSPHGGIAIKTNFVNAGGDESLIKDVTAAQLSVRGITAGAGVNVARSTDGNSIEISTSDSGLYALLYLSAATTTTIAAANAPVLISGTWAEQRSNSAAVTTSGRVTYTGATAAQAVIDASICFEPASGASKSLSIYLYKNGVKAAGSRCNVVASAGESVSAVATWQDQLTNGDYYEVYVENNTDAENIQVNTAILRVT